MAIPHGLRAACASSTAAHVNGLLAICCAVCITAAFAAAASRSASVYGVTLRFGHPLALWALLTTVVCQTWFALNTEGAVSLIGMLALASAGVSAVSDWQTGYVFDVVTIAAFAGMAALSALCGAGQTVVLGALTVGGVLAFLHLITLGRGIGLGDAKLGCCIGALLGVSRGLMCLNVAFLLGGTIAATLLATKRARFGNEMRFAPFLAIAMGTVLLCR